MISLNIWAKQGAGTIKSNQIADELITLFTDKTLGIVETGVPFKTVLGEDNGRYQINITVPFQRRTT